MKGIIINAFFTQKSLSSPQLGFKSETLNEFQNNIAKILSGKDLALSSLDNLSDELENEKTEEDIYESKYSSNIILILRNSQNIAWTINYLINYLVIVHIAYYK